LLDLALGRFLALLELCVLRRKFLDANVEPLDLGLAVGANVVARRVGGDCLILIGLSDLRRAGPRIFGLGLGVLGLGIDDGFENVVDIFRLRRRRYLGEAPQDTGPRFLWIEVIQAS